MNINIRSAVIVDITHDFYNWWYMFLPILILSFLLAKIYQKVA